MNHADRLFQQALKDANAVLVRSDKHNVFKLPNGQTLVTSKTSGDWRNSLNNLATLKRQLAIGAKTTPEVEMNATDAINATKEYYLGTICKCGGDKISGSNACGNCWEHDNQGNDPVSTAEEKTVEVVLPPPVSAPLAPLPLPEPALVAAPPVTPLQARMREQEQFWSREYERLLSEADAAEKRVDLLRRLEVFAADPHVEQILRELMPGAPAPSARRQQREQPREAPPPIDQDAPKPTVKLEAEPAPAPAPRPAPPDVITDRVQVTRELVFAATQTFDAAFTINDLRDLMTQGREMDLDESVRIRTAIAQSMVSLVERGQVLKVETGNRRQPAIYRKAKLHGASARASRAN